MTFSEYIVSELVLANVLGHMVVKNRTTFNPVRYIADITSGKMADCDWLRDTFNRLLVCHNTLPKTTHFKTKQQN